MPNVPADPSVLHPVPAQPRIVLLKPLITSPLIEVGEFSYYDDSGDPTVFETRNVLYHYGPEKLIIGKFCALGEGVRFIMNGANHRMDGPSTFPFPIMSGSWADHVDLITGLPGLVDQPADRGPAVDPGSRVDGLAWVVYRRVKGSASVGTMMVVVALELGKDGAQVPFTVDQQMIEALSA